MSFINHIPSLFGVALLIGNIPCFGMELDRDFEAAQCVQVMSLPEFYSDDTRVEYTMSSPEPYSDDTRDEHTMSSPEPYSDDTRVEYTGDDLPGFMKWLNSRSDFTPLGLHAVPVFVDSDETSVQYTGDDLEGFMRWLNLPILSNQESLSVPESKPATRLPKLKNRPS